jgi:putative PEP-CTERM system integral membrane protein
MKANLRKRDLLAYGLFWSWNLIFLAFMVLGFAPRLLPELIESVRTGLTPPVFLAYGLILSLVPLAAVLLGLTVLRHKPGSLFALGYVVEGPLMLVLAIRFFLIRQSTPGLVHVLVTALLGIGAFTWYLLDPEVDRRSRWVGYLRLLGLTLMLLTSLYAALWIAFYALPLTAVALGWLRDTLLAPIDSLRGFARSIQEMLQQGLAWVPFMVLGFLLVLYTASLFVVAPVAVPLLSVRGWLRELRALVKRSGWARPVIVVALTITVSVALFVATNRQPQKVVFKLLETPPGTPQQARTLLEKEADIRAGLLNAYLAPYRYFSSVGEVRHVRDIYQQVFGLSEQRAYGVQQLYEGVARPLLYDPVYPLEYPDLKDNWAFSREPEEAARRYQQFFDTPIADGERQQIVSAVRTTWNADRATAAWQAVDDREVLLTRQEINITEYGDWAEVELYEVYQNQTRENQEVVYYFNLPESTVLTGVWLGNSAARNERFVYRVAPRGAAQAVYRNETRLNRDPALLEQIGPRQYRLRAFPVPPIRERYDPDLGRMVISNAGELHMWMAYRTLSRENSWPLPQLAERRNVYWDVSSVRLVNGEPLDGETPDWLPESAPASQIIEPADHRFDLPGGESVLALPYIRGSLPELPGGLQLAVVLDRSYSMGAHAAEVSASLARLEELRTVGAQVDVILSASRYRGEPPARVSLVEVELGEIFYFGGQNAAELLVQYAELSAGRDYDAVLIFTDGSGYELGDSPVEVPIPDAPVWMVHLGGDIPLGYDDQTLEAIQASGGGVSGDLEQALGRLALRLDAAREGFSQDVLDGYVWSLLPTDAVDDFLADAPAVPVDQDQEGFGALAARQLVLAEITRQRGSIDQLETLDWLHELAMQYEIVTPYSSMIVLVNPHQEAILDHLEGESDRFEREVEAVGDTTPATETPLSGVPEPHEWLLIGLAVAMLAWYAYRRRFALQPR